MVARRGKRRQGTKGSRSKRLTSFHSSAETRPWSCRSRALFDACSSVDSVRRPNMGHILSHGPINMRHRYPPGNDMLCAIKSSFQSLVGSFLGFEPKNNVCGGGSRGNCRAAPVDIYLRAALLVLPLLVGGACVRGKFTKSSINRSLHRAVWQRPTLRIGLCSPLLVSSLSSFQIRHVTTAGFI